MDISSVRIRPVQVRAQAVMTSTHGHLRLNWPAVAKVNNSNYPHKIWNVCVMLTMMPLHHDG